MWPWGEQWEEHGCHAGTGEFGSFPTGGCCFSQCVEDTCFEVCDFVGNVSEWVADFWDEECYGDTQVMIAGGPSHVEPDQHNGYQEDPEAPGCWLMDQYGLYRPGLHHHTKTTAFDDDGFRCTMSLL
jgi:formylglycine-generating enzyme required for sulfatase activity